MSFSSSHLARLEQEEYANLCHCRPKFDTPDSFWVCEKSDGIRVLMYICRVEDGHDVFLVRPHVFIRLALNLSKIDRKNMFRLQGQGFFFPHYEDKKRPMRDCLLDGELVLDKVPGHGDVMHVSCDDTTRHMTPPTGSSISRL